MVKALLFDFDGVILESADIKTAAYRRLFEREYPDKLEELPASLIKYPLIHATERIKQEEISPYLISIPEPENEIKDKLLHS